MARKRKRKNPEVPPKRHSYAHPVSWDIVKPNPEPVTLVIAGGIGLTVLFAWLLSLVGKPKKKGASIPGPGPGPVEGVPLPVPAPGPGQQGEAGVYISPDCQTVTMGSAFLATVVVPKAGQFAQQGIGAPIYPSNATEKSLDRVIREILLPYNYNCVNNAPWLDRYVQNNPIPQPTTGDTIQSYRDKLSAWDDAWDVNISSFAAGNPQLFNLFKQVGGVVAATYAGVLGVDVNYVPQDLGNAPPNLTNTDRNRFRELGYDLYQFVVEQFQGDYNLVREYQTQSWYAQGLDITVDNVIGTQTRDAMLDALGMQAAQGPWQVLVQTAKNA